MPSKFDWQISGTDQNLFNLSNKEFRKLQNDLMVYESAATCKCYFALGVRHRLNSKGDVMANNDSNEPSSMYRNIFSTQLAVFYLQV